MIGSTVHHDRIDCTSWSDRLYIMIGSTVHHDRVDCTSWSDWLCIMIGSTVHHDRIDCASWSDRLCIMIRSTVHHDWIDCTSWSDRLYIMIVTLVVHWLLPHCRHDHYQPDCVGKETSLIVVNSVWAWVFQALSDHILWLIRTGAPLCCVNVSGICGFTQCIESLPKVFSWLWHS